MRKAEMSRSTNETEITISLNLDGKATFSNDTGIGFLDHMLDQLSKHSLIDLTTTCKGDLYIDDHHSVEDIGITLGLALKSALGNKIGIQRYGSCLLPMDDALIQSALDISGRPSLVWNVPFGFSKIGSFDVELVQEFFNSFCLNAGINMHVTKLAGNNNHHIVEAIFKSIAKSLRLAVQIDHKQKDELPSTKGTL